ncbi:hypothetical protein SLEP1_g58420 [Rubroshorea leprosula]|uniref:Uncharacterized protein n=1 Tax=Rubroshorea leprosula TaxID=152421 RepID=A0AAV5MPC6_9ROSI|nr:hypothetical protein SLEP1_g58420 [Rubroshorea leprosula]
MRRRKDNKRDREGGGGVGISYFLKSKNPGYLIYCLTEEEVQQEG